MPEWIVVGGVGSGGSAPGTWVTQTPTGTLDGVNKVFTLTYIPVVLFLFLNGVFQVEGIDFTISSSTITYANAPHVNPKSRDSGYMVAKYQH